MTGERRIIEASALGIRIDSSTDISDALDTCLGTEGLVLTENDLGPDFFDLRTGLAGELFQKFTNYRVRVAIVLTDPNVYGERFAQLAYEHASHRLIRFVPSLREANSWLSA
jgi:hypothetical protein